MTQWWRRPYLTQRPLDVTKCPKALLLLEKNVYFMRKQSKFNLSFNFPFQDKPNLSLIWLKINRSFFEHKTTTSKRRNALKAQVACSQQVNNQIVAAQTCTEHVNKTFRDGLLTIKSFLLVSQKSKLRQTSAFMCRYQIFSDTDHKLLTWLQR